MSPGEDTQMVGLDGRVAVVTGAAQGIGRAHALALARAGAAVLAVDRDEAAVGETVEQIVADGGVAESEVRILGTIADGMDVVEAAWDRFGGADIVVNNAGVSVPTDLVDIDDEALDLHLGVHLRATVGATRAAFARWGSSAWGRVVTTTSGHGVAPRNAGSSAYAAAKAAVFGFTRAAALEAPEGVTVNAVAPLALTRMSSGYLAAIEGADERFAPSHVARVVRWLCSDAASGVTGRVIRIEGDMVGEYEVVPGALVPFERIEEVLSS